MLTSNQGLFTGHQMHDFLLLESSVKAKCVYSFRCLRDRKSAVSWSNSSGPAYTGAHHLKPPPWQPEERLICNTPVSVRNAVAGETAGDKALLLLSTRLGSGPSLLLAPLAKRNCRPIPQGPTPVSVPEQRPGQKDKCHIPVNS